MLCVDLLYPYTQKSIVDSLCISSNHLGQYTSLIRWCVYPLRSSEGLQTSEGQSPLIVRKIAMLLYIPASWKFAIHYIKKCNIMQIAIKSVCHSFIHEDLPCEI